MSNTNGFKLYCCGSRGSRSVEGIKFTEYGGFTSCYILKKDDYALVIDCGTGFYSAASIIANCKKVDIVLTHMHYDHILGFLDWNITPKGAKVTCYAGFDEWFGEKSIEEFFRRPFWPATPNLAVKNVPKDFGPLELSKNISVNFYPAPHPDGAKLIIITEQTAEKTNKLVIMFDCEKADGLDKDLIENADILIYDGMYDDSEYEKHIGWGHSTWQEGVRLAQVVNPKRLIITHHESGRTDEVLNKYEKKARENFIATDFARAGQMWDLPPAKVTREEEPQPEVSERKQKMNDFIEKATNLLLDRVKLLKVSNMASCIILGGVSLFMTIVNVFTGKQLLMYSTAIFSALCLIDFILMVPKKEKLTQTATLLFQIEIVLLFTFFIVSGTPEGFSIIWILLLPTAGMFVFGRKRASIISGLMFAVLIFFFQTPVGRSFLQYEYTESYMLRFPMAFVAFFVMSFFLETVRSHTLVALETLKANQDITISRQFTELRDQNLELIRANAMLERKQAEEKEQ